MNYSSYNASISVCMQHIVNLSINTWRLISYRPLSTYEMLEYNGSQDVLLNFQNGGNNSR